MSSSAYRTASRALPRTARPRPMPSLGSRRPVREAEEPVFGWMRILIEFGMPLGLGVTAIVALARSLMSPEWGETRSNQREAAANRVLTSVDGCLRNEASREGDACTACAETGITRETP
jgi:hypothetical protein